MASRRGLPINGVLLLDKPDGVSSNHALQHARRILQARKAGHTGTLDPFATGLMVLCFGEATKYSAGMFEADKSYLATVQFGTETDSGDLTGTPVPLPGAIAPPTAAAAIEAVLATYLGPQWQIPPMHSALKRDGKPLYAYARAGVVLERPARPIRILGLQLVSYDAAQGQAVLAVDCTKGTYVRTLAQDIGRALGCGAHLVGLRRTRTAGFDLGQAVTPEALAGESAPAERLLSVDSLLAGLPACALSPEVAARFQLGQTVPAPAAVAATPGTALLRIYAQPAAGVSRFLGTARQRGPWLVPDRLIAFDKEVSS